MPLPAIALGGAVVAIGEAIVARVAAFLAMRGVTAAVGAFVGSMVAEIVRSDWFALLLREGFSSVIVEYARANLGLELNPDDPLSKQSFAAAISTRLGFPIRDITDRELVLEDVEAMALSRVNARLGTEFRTLRDQAMLIEDVGALVRDRLNERLGTRFENFFVRWPPDTVALREQFSREALLQLERAITGDGATFFSAAAVSQITTRVLEVNNRIAPISAPVTRRRAFSRTRSTKYYDGQRRSGYRRIWVHAAQIRLIHPNATGPEIEPPAGDGAMFLDPSTDPPTLWRYSSALRQWVQQPTQNPG